MYPVLIKVDNKKDLYLKWNDGTHSRISLEKLRNNCPCATCAAQKDRQSLSYIPILHESQKKVENVKQVGSYAISVTWKDGHNTGIYEYTFLRKLAQN